MKILIVGSGGREHALAWKSASAGSVEQVFVAPGNAGCAKETGVTTVDIPADDINALADFAREQNVDLTIIGPEQPLVAGVVDHFVEQGLAVFGPTAAAAALEGSKAFSKDFLARNGIPTARYQNITNLSDAAEFVETLTPPIVVKADGLAAGKGVIIAQDRREALSTVRDMLSGDAFGSAGNTVVIEEFLHGEEASFIAIVDGKNVLPLASSQDHKAVFDGDNGPNTGGMGAYSPAPVVTDAVHDHIMLDIIQPTVAAMAAEGRAFTGFLYAGLMIDNGRARVIEFNVRLGDPETQPLLMRLESDLVTLCLSALTGDLDTQSISWKKEPAVGVVLAADGYPGNYEKGKTITGLDAETTDCKVFHAGTRIEGGDVVTSGGRVLCVTAVGNTVSDARKLAYERAAQISWEGAFYRKDIAYRALDREKNR